MLFSLSTVKQAFDNASAGKHYLSKRDLTVFFVELFGEPPRLRQLKEIGESFDVEIRGKSIGLSLPKLILYIEGAIGGSIPHSIQPNCHELHALFESLDRRDKNFLVEEDLVAGCSCAELKLLKGCLRIVFNSFDADRDNRVSFRDFIDGITEENGA